MAHDDSGSASPDSQASTVKEPTKVGRFIDTIMWTPPRCRYDPERPPKFTFTLNLLFAFAATFTVANLYYNHPILNKMAATFNVSYEKVSIVPTLMQAGYATGLLFLNPLGDLFRRRTLVLSLILATTICWIVLCVTMDFKVFAGFSFIVGIGTVTPQLMLPLVGDLAPPEKRAQALSWVTSGLLLGMLLARVLSGIVTEFTGWRTVYWVALGLQFFIFFLLWMFMPDYPSTNPSGLSYFQILHSLGQLIMKHPTLVQAALIGLAVSAVFTLYWTTLTFLLAAAPYHYNSLEIGMFGLIGVAAIFLTPLIGRNIVDKYSPSLGLLLGLISVMVGQLIGTFAGLHSVAGPVVQAFLVDIGIQASQVSNRTTIYKLENSARNRVNSVYMLGFFFGQVVGTSTGAPLYNRHGWVGSGGAGVGFAGLGLLALAARSPREKRLIGWSGGWRTERNEAVMEEGTQVSSGSNKEQPGLIESQGVKI